MMRNKSIFMMRNISILKIRNLSIFKIRNRSIVLSMSNCSSTILRKCRNNVQQASSNTKLHFNSSTSEIINGHRTPLLGNRNDENAVSFVPIIFNNNATSLQCTTITNCQCGSSCGNNAMIADTYVQIIMENTQNYNPNDNNFSVFVIQSILQLYFELDI